MDRYNTPEAPPSTLAANLVNNLSSLRRPSRQNEQEDLQKLLLEVSKYEESTDDKSLPETVIEHHHKLIYVVAKALLEVLTRDNLLTNEKQLLDQASQGLDVLIATIEETPEVLARTTSDITGLHAVADLPLWVWLFPRLLALVGRERCQVLQEKITAFFRAAFRAASRSLQIWALNSGFFRYLQHCADAVLDCLYNQSVSVLAHSRALGLVLPSPGIDVDIITQTELKPVLEGCTYELNDIPGALRHTGCLLAMLAEISSAAASSNDTTSAFQDYIGWMLDSLYRLRDVEATLGPYSAIQGPSSELCIQCFHAVYSLMFSLRKLLSESMLRKGYYVLTHFCVGMLEFPEAFSQAPIQLSFCSSLLDLAAVSAHHEPIAQLVSIRLLPALPGPEDSQTNPIVTNPDFRQCVKILERRFEPSAADDGSNHFESSELAGQFRYLDLVNNSTPIFDTTRPNKRRKICSGKNLLSEVVEEVYLLLGSQKASDLDGLSQVAGDCFAHLGVAKRCRALKCLGYVPCASAGTLTVTRDRDGTILDANCSICNSSQITCPRTDKYEDSTVREAIAAFTKLVGVPEFEESRRPRVLGMFALRSFARHYNDNSFMNLETSILGQWCLKSLRSSMRELRIAAGRTLPAFLREDIDPEVSRKNKVNALDILRSISQQSPTHLTETYILAWGQVGRVSKDQELNLVLLRLVEYLGHTNQIASAVAFHEIQNLADSFGMPVGVMFCPFWRSIGPTAVKDSQTRPQAVQLLADLLGMSVSDFFVMTQAEILPWLVLTNNKEVILKVTHARKDENPFQTCLVDSNLARILALLLVQNVPNLEDFIMALFRDISPQFNDMDLNNLLRMDPVGTALELLKIAGEEDESKRSRVRHALQFLANSSYNSGVDSSSGRRSNQTGPFLEQYVLPIISQLSNSLNTSLGWDSPVAPVEKRRSLKGIEEILRVGKSYTRKALPQICACLQSALVNNETRPTAFSAWKTMIRSLDDEDVGPLLEDTFSTIIMYWKTFDSASRTHAIDLIVHLLRQRLDLLREYIYVIPSLAQIYELVDYEKELGKMREETDVWEQYHTFCRRLKHEHESVVTQALAELANYLQEHQSLLQASAVSEQPESVVGELLRAILDSCVKFGGSNLLISHLTAECVGLVGCLDSNRVEAVRERREVVVVSNFEDGEDTTDFILFILKEVLVKAFLSANNPRLQGFLSWAMQEILQRADFSEACLDHRKSGDHSEAEKLYRKWLSLPDSVRQTLAPFLKSRYRLGDMVKIEIEYPIFQPTKKYAFWLRAFVLDLLNNPYNDKAELIYAPLTRVIRIEDLSAANFLLPYAVLHAVVSGADEKRVQIRGELLRILAHEAAADSHFERTNLRQCSEAVFRVLDYLSRWTQEKQVKLSQQRGFDSRWTQHTDDDLPPETGIERVTELILSIPAEIISRRAVECESYSRALFHWEQHIRQVRENASDKVSTAPLLERLQEIYTQIDEPDGIEGISAHLHVLDIDQQILGHRKAGRWTAAQTWYEIKLAENPDDVDVQVNLLYCLKESGQHDVLLNYVEGMHKTSSAVSKLLPFATEASWATGRWDTLQNYLSLVPEENGGDFNISIGRTLLALHRKDGETFAKTIRTLRERIASSLSPSATASLSVCHDTMLKFHVLTELEMIAGPDGAMSVPRQSVLESLDRRLEAIGAYLNDKQYLLGIRRAAMQLSSPFTKEDVASAWLTSARLARKGNSVHQSFNAVLHASQLGDAPATIEHARLLWKEGNHRKAIQSLQGAIETNAFIHYNRGPVENSVSFLTEGTEHQNLLTARAHLLLAKWLDSAGQTHSSALRSQYQLAAKLHSQWEKGHYYLGRHYNKLFESEKLLAPEHQAQTYLIGETAKLVIENYLRSLNYGTKYIYQTLPRVLTLWLDLGIQVNQVPDSKYGTKEFIVKLMSLRKEQLSSLHNRFSKYIQKIPAYQFYTALPQIVARIAHPNAEVYKYLQQIIVKVVSTHPQQALWSLLAVSTSTQADRKNRGLTILAALRNTAKKADIGGFDLRTMIKNGEKLANELLMACNAGDFQGNRTVTASITKDLGFNHKICTPSPLAMPVESVLTATLPTLTDSVKTHKAFSRDVVTITQFLDEVLVLSSLQKPRKLTARGSDGKTYGLLCKPKDDLRKDQRLMEFNSMINRSLKRDAESSKRQLYIKTYAVTPLNEECGIIEWVDGLKTLRDILLSLYKVKRIIPNYGEIKAYLDEAQKDNEKLPLFTEKVLRNYPPVFHSWFVQQFPEPPAWFAARLRYTRSCAVMSMVGTILGLGDRHGENILFEEGNGGTFHVDFNCLFDKGLTFAQPERVPFRLTHNMIDAMGVYGYEGPFRKSSELTLKLLRQHEETLMTILEAFVYDPTLDFIAKKNARRREREAANGVPDTAQGVLDSVRRKVRGFLAGESVPLGVEGQVDELIKQAISPRNLAAMYIGWCAFF